MAGMSAIDRVLRTNDIFSLPGGPEGQVREARQMIDTFNQVNRIIQDPETAPKLHEKMEQTAQFNQQVLNTDLANRLGKGLKLDVWA